MIKFREHTGLSESCLRINREFESIGELFTYIANQVSGLNTFAIKYFRYDFQSKHHLFKVILQIHSEPEICAGLIYEPLKEKQKQDYRQLLEEAGIKEDTREAYEHGGITYEANPDYDCLHIRKYDKEHGGAVFYIEVKKTDLSEIKRVITFLKDFRALENN